MKIVYACSATLPSQTAGSINIVRSCNAMARLGHDVVLLAPSNGDGRIDTDKDIWSYYNVERNFEIVGMPTPSVLGGRHLFALLCAAFIYFRKPDLVYGRYLRTTHYACRLGFDSVLELHSRVKKKRKNLESLTALPILRKIVTLTEELKRHFLDIDIDGINNESIMVAPCGSIDPDIELHPMDLPKSTPNLDIGYAGKLNAEKGLGLIGEIVALCPDHDFHIAGGEAEDVRLWRREIPNPNVHFHGYLAQTRVLDFIGAMDICLLPNRPAAESSGGMIYSSPMKLFDYMALGKMVLASDSPEVREVLPPEAGVILDPWRPTAWADAIQNADTPQRELMGNKARNYYRGHYTLTDRYRKILYALDLRKG